MAVEPTGWLRARYWVLAGVVFALMVSQAAKGWWLGDFWHYSAVVRELATRPLAPMHPFFAIDAPHPFYSPYAYSVALFSRLVNIDAVSALGYAGLANYALWIITLRRLVVRLTESEAAAFYALLFTLLLWGPGLFFSGFFKIGTLGFVLPYASTFGAAVMYFALERQLVWVQRPRHVLLAQIAVALWLLLLTHPPTAAAALVGVVAFAVAAESDRLRKTAWTLGAIAIAFIGTLAWPLLPFFELLTGFSSSYHLGNRAMYGVRMATSLADAARTLGSMVWPALVGLPLIALRLRGRALDPLALFFGGLLLVYAYGFATRSWGFGRVLPTLVFTLHLATAAWVAQLEPTRWALRKRPLVAGYAVLIAATLGLAAWQTLPAGLDYLPGRTRHFPPGGLYRLIEELVEPGAVVLCDPAGAEVIATFGAKVVAAGGPEIPLPFVGDIEQRRADVTRFFDVETTEQERRAIIEKYDARFVLFNNDLDRRVADAVRALGVTSTQLIIHELVTLDR